MDFVASSAGLEVDYTFALACTRRALAIVLATSLIHISVLVITSRKVRLLNMYTYCKLRHDHSSGRPPVASPTYR